MKRLKASSAVERYQAKAKNERDFWG